MTHLVIFFAKVPHTVNLNTLIGIRISNYLWTPLRLYQEGDKTEKVELDTLIRKRIYNWRRSMSVKVRSSNDKGVVENLTDLHNKYVVVPAEKASNNIVFVCKTYHIDRLRRLSIKNNMGNPTYTQTSRSNLLGYLLKMITLTYPLYIGYLSYTKSLSKLLTTVLSTVKDGLQTYCDTAYSRHGINQMWILKNSKHIVESLSSQSLSVITSIKTFDCSTLYTTLPHPMLKSRLKDLATNSFRARSGKRRYS